MLPDRYSFRSIFIVRPITAHEDVLLLDFSCKAFQSGQFSLFGPSLLAKIFFALLPSVMAFLSVNLIVACFVVLCYSVFCAFVSSTTERNFWSQSSILASLAVVGMKTSFTYPLITISLLHI